MKNTHTFAEESLVKTSLLIKGLAGVVFVVIIPLELLITSTLRDWGGSLIYDIQEYRTQNLDNFFKAASYIGDSWLIIVLGPAFYNFFDTRKAIKLIIISSFTGFITSFLQLLFQEPRPFWTNSDLRGLNCDLGFADPSFHMMMGTVFFFTLAIEFFHSWNNIFRYIAYFFVFLILSLLGFSRVYLGEQFPHQVIMGLGYSFIYLTVVFAFDRSLLDMTIKSSFNYKSNRKYIVYWFVATMFLLLASVTVFDVITLNNDISYTWVKNSTKHCSLSYKVSGSQSFYYSAWIFYNLGLVSSSMLSGKYISMFWWCTEYWKRGIRFLIAVATSAGIYFAFNQIDTHDVTTTYVWHYVFPYFLMAAVYGGILPLIFVKMQLAMKLSPSVDQENELMTLNAID